MRRAAGVDGGSCVIELLVQPCHPRPHLSPLPQPPRRLPLPPLPLPPPPSLAGLHACPALRLPSHARGACNHSPTCPSLLPRICPRQAPLHSVLPTRRLSLRWRSATCLALASAPSLTTATTRTAPRMRVTSNSPPGPPPSRPATLRHCLPAVRPLGRLPARLCSAARPAR